MKRCIALLVLVVLFLHTTVPCANAVEIAKSTDCISLDSVGRSTVSNIVITDSNINYISNSSEIPIEVRDRLNELMNSSSTDSTIGLILPTSSNESLYAENAPASIESADPMNWSYYRTYNGYQMRDYIIVYDTAHNMANILESESSKNAAGFSKTIAALCGGAIIDEFLPFGSTIATLVDFILGDDADSITTQSGDKASAAPNFCRYEYYTYVTTANGEMLGCTTYYSKIESITWYYYNQAEDTQYAKVKSYNKYLYSTNFSNRDAIAYSSYLTNPHGDDPLSLKIGTKQFSV